MTEQLKVVANPAKPERRLVEPMTEQLKVVANPAKPERRLVYGTFFFID